jgi:hypothetical protein
LAAEVRAKEDQQRRQEEQFRLKMATLEQEVLAFMNTS